MIFERELTLYRANNKILMLERKLDDKNEKYTLLNREYQFYKKAYEKLKSDDDSNQNVVYHSISLNFFVTVTEYCY